MSDTLDGIKAVFKEAEENRKRLRGCQAPHEFVPLPLAPGQPIRDRRYQCKKCQGTVPRRDFLWYLEGLSHGRQLSQKDG